MSDEEAIIYLSELRQIGRWSAEMILLFTYNRPNIWPIQDIGLLRAISKNYNKKYLSKKDQTLSGLIKSYESPSETILTSRRDIFFSLCKSIIGQQISVAAANSVFLKFKKKCKNKINAKTVSKLTFVQLKSCGLSRQKVLGIKSLAMQTIEKTFNTFYFLPT